MVVVHSVPVQVTGLQEAVQAADPLDPQDLLDQEVVAPEADQEVAEEVINSFFSYIIFQRNYWKS